MTKKRLVKISYGMSHTPLKNLKTLKGLSGTWEAVLRGIMRLSDFIQQHFFFVKHVELTLALVFPSYWVFSRVRCSHIL